MKQMESAKQRLTEFRHIQLHNQSSQLVPYRTADEARRFVERVLGDMQALFISRTICLIPKQNDFGSVLKPREIVPDQVTPGNYSQADLPRNQYRL